MVVISYRGVDLNAVRKSSLLLISSYLYCCSINFFPEIIGSMHVSFDLSVYWWNRFSHVFGLNFSVPTVASKATASVVFHNLLPWLCQFRSRLTAPCYNSSFFWEERSPVRQILFLNRCLGNRKSCIKLIEIDIKILKCEINWIIVLLRRMLLLCFISCLTIEGHWNSTAAGCL